MTNTEFVAHLNPTPVSKYTVRFNLTFHHHTSWQCTTCSPTTNTQNQQSNSKDHFAWQPPTPHPLTSHTIWTPSSTLYWLYHLNPIQYPLLATPFEPHPVPLTGHTIWTPSSTLYWPHHLNAIQYPLLATPFEPHPIPLTGHTIWTPSNTPYWPHHLNPIQYPLLATSFEPHPV